MRKRFKALAVGALTAVTTITGAASAFAVPTYYSGDNCGISSNDFYFLRETCPDAISLFYHQNYSGALASINGDISNLSAEPTYAYEGSTVVLQYYTDYVFWGEDASPNNDGENQATRNNAASAYNSSTSHSYTVYVSPNYTGHTQTFGPRSGGNLNSYLRNNEASVSKN
ncbi:hypothetical protein ABH935_006668 [Catenulispora sp. GAS73]|uniref:hypothetical protein n=1 Tax=Catenulispora sp. GAS73 TaxID=3156269 RepID=UPI003511F03A